MTRRSSETQPALDPPGCVALVPGWAEVLSDGPGNLSSLAPAAASTLGCSDLLRQTPSGKALDLH